MADKDPYDQLLGFLKKTGNDAPVQPEKAPEQPFILTPGVIQQHLERPVERQRGAESDPMTRTLNDMKIPADTKQLVVVTSGSWNSVSGDLRRFERAADGSWQSVGNDWQVNVGRNGMGWALGLINNRVTPGQDSAGPAIDANGRCYAGNNTKCEGDGKAPAGVFELGFAFGKAANAPPGSKVEYRQTIPGVTMWGSEPGDRANYNRWMEVDPRSYNPKAHPDNEEMYRKDNLYDLGLVVKENWNQVPNGGSAIFMHNWRRAGAGTDGCTSMSEQNMKDLVRWVNPNAKPLLIQVPADQFDSLRLAQLRRY